MSPSRHTQSARFSLCIIGLRILSVTARSRVLYRRSSSRWMSYAPPHHPKWQEVDIGRSVPGWTRFAAAEQWIAGEHAGGREDSGKSGSTQEPGAGAPPSAGSDEDLSISGLDKNEREALFREFLGYQRNKKRSLFADFQSYVKPPSPAGEARQYLAQTSSPEAQLGPVRGLPAACCDRDS